MVSSSSADDIITRVAWMSPWRMKSACKRVWAVHVSKIPFKELAISVPSPPPPSPPPGSCLEITWKGLSWEWGQDGEFWTHSPIICSRNKLKAKYVLVVWNFLARYLDILFESNRVLHGKRSSVYCFSDYKPLRVERVLALHLFSSLSSFCFSFSGKKILFKTKQNI